MQTFTDFFNPYDPDHIEAIIVLNATGALPQGFLPDNVEMDHLWQISIQGKMALAWIDNYTGESEVHW